MIFLFHYILYIRLSSSLQKIIFYHEYIRDKNDFSLPLYINIYFVFTFLLVFYHNLYMVKNYFVRQYISIFRHYNILCYK